MKRYEVHWENEIDTLVEKYNSLDKRSKECKELKKQINLLMKEEEKRVGRKLYHKL